MDAAAKTSTGQPGWQARIDLGFRARAQRTVLAERQRHGPLAVQRPFYPEGGICHVYLLHPPGGVVGGDSLDIRVRVEEDAQALLTTPGATKFYRTAGAMARQHQHLSVGPGASLEWLPQENILFPGADVALDTTVELHGDARLALWEIQCLGRPVIGEAFDQGRLDSRLTILRDGVPLLVDRLRVSAENRARLSLMADLPVGGSLVVSHAGEAEIETCRDLLLAEGSEYVGATLIDDLLLVRYLGHSTEQARRLFTEIWQAVRPSTIRQGRGKPRIWAT